MSRRARIAIIGGSISFVAFVASVLIGSASQGTALADVAAYGVLVSLVASLVFLAIGNWHRDETKLIARSLRQIDRELSRPLHVPKQEGPFVVRHSRARARIRRELRILRLAFPLMLLVAIFALEWWLRLDH